MPKFWDRFQKEKRFLQSAKKFFIYLSAGIYLLLVVFLIFRTSDHPTVFGKYSVRYALLILSYLVLFYPFLRLARFFLRRESSILFQLLACFVPFLLCLLPLEIFLRLNYYDVFKERDINSFHPFLQAAPKRGDPELHINSSGFRGNEISKVKPKGTYRIFIMGGSTTFTADIPFGKSFTADLEKRLRAHYPQKEIEVVNAGYPWHTTQHSLISYLFQVKDYQPDMVIMWHGINDMYRSFSPRRFAYGDFKPDYSHFYGPVSNMVFRYFKAEPPVSVHLVSVVYLLRAFYKMISVDKLIIRFLKPVEVAKFPSIDPYRRNLISFLNILKADDVRLILGTQPVLYREGLSQKESNSLWVYQTMCRMKGTYASFRSVTFGMNQFNETTREIAAFYQVPLIDFEAKMPKTGEYMWDDCHYTLKGNDFIGNEIFQALISGHYLEDENKFSA